MAEQKGGSGEVRNKKILISTDADENFPGNASDGNGTVVGGEQVQGLDTDEDDEMITRIDYFEYGHPATPISTQPSRYSTFDDLSEFRAANLCNVVEDHANQEFGRDPNRLDYFSVAPFDVFGDDHLTVISRYGGGVGGRQDRGVVEGPKGNDTTVADAGIRLRRVPVGISSNNYGTETELQRLKQEKGNGGDGGGSSGGVVGPRLEQERGSSETAGAGGGDMTRDVPLGVFGNNGGDGGEAVVERLLRLKQDGATVTVRVAVMVVMLLMMVMVMVKMEVKP